MFTDIVLPNDNEQAFIDMGNKLGFKNMIFLYPYANFNKAQQDADKLEKYEMNIFFGLIASSKIRAETSLIVAKSSDYDREIIEKGVDILFGLEDHGNKDFMHQRNSGLNHVLCRLAKTKKTRMGFSIRTILISKGVKRAQIMGRMSQNIKLCRKFGNETVLASFSNEPYEMRSPSDIQALAMGIGMHPKVAKESLTNSYKAVLYKQKKKTPNYISDGAEFLDY